MLIRNLVILLTGTALSISVMGQNAPLFPRGEQAKTDHQVGTIWLSELSPADSTFSFSTTMATFAPDARLHWHSHPGGQILLYTDGVGYYQERGKPRQTVRKGDVIRCQPGVEHWHGATPTSGVTYIATTPTQKGKTSWFGRVTDADYSGKP